MQTRRELETKERSLKDLFHLVKQVLPETQELLTFSPEKPVAEAFAVMHKRNFSQVPVVEGNQVLGVFSYRSFAEGVARLPRNVRDPLALPVEEFTEKLRFAQITDELNVLLDEFDLKDAVLVGSENRLQGIVTTVDTLRYFYKVASEYVMLREIELSIRELIRVSVNENELEECIDKSLKKQKEESKQEVPTYLEEMTLHDYVMILRHKDTWGKFSAAFGIDRRVVCAKLDPLPKLRNDVFHFRRNITIQEYDTLRRARDWLLKRISKFEARRRIGRRA